jgi:thioredoxin-like negative regulator of GroEL
MREKAFSFFLTSFALFLSAVPPCSAAEVEWRSSYPDARREAVEKNKPLVIDFGTKTCYWCRQLEARTFSEATVLSTMNDRFIPLRIDAEEQPRLAEQLQISSYPTVVLASADGRILHRQEGFVEAGKFLDLLHNALTSVNDPEWMLRDYAAAGKAIAASDYPQAIALLKHVTEDNGKREVQVKAQALLRDLEQQASGRLAHARQCVDKGQTSEALETVTALVRSFPGTQAAGEGARILTQIGTSPETKVNQRTRRARDLLALAREDYRTGEYLVCLNRCNLLINGFGDLPEGSEATQLAAEIKNNPEWLQSACDTLADQLGGLHLSLAEAYLKKGQPQQAVVYLEKVVQCFPNTRQAEAAQVRLSQIQGQPTRPVDFKKP